VLSDYFHIPSLLFIGLLFHWYLVINNIGYAALSAGAAKKLFGRYKCRVNMVLEQ